MRRLVLIGALLLAICQMRAEGPDEQCVEIYNVIQQGDALASDQPAQALAKYLEAQASLTKLQKGYPDWNEQVVKFRLEYLAEKIAGIAVKTPLPSRPTPGNSEVQLKQQPVPAKPAQPTAAVAAPAISNPSEGEVAGLKEQVRQLQSDKGLLENKLKEALAAQP